MANLRFGKGIRVKAAEAHVCGNLDVVQRIVEDFCNWRPKQLQPYHKFWYPTNAFAA
jgi:hypothetical protein